MRITFGIPKKEPVVSIEAEVTEQQIRTGLVKLYQVIKAKLPFKIEVGKNDDTRQD